MCIRDSPSCARWLVTKKFGCKRAHINEYDNNTHEAGQSLPASRGADGRTTITRLTSTYEHSECIQKRRLGPPPPPKHTHRLRANRQREAARRRQQTPEQMAVDRQRHATRRQQETTQAREARCVCIRPWVCVYVCVCIRPARVGWLQKSSVAKERTSISTITTHTRQDNPYRLRAALTGVIG